jgi:hypothetical protein
MAKDKARRHVSASDVIADAQGALGRRVSAAMSLPGPIRAPEELGVRPAEGQVSTREAAVPGSPVDMAPTAGLEAGIAAPATERSHPSALRRKVGLVVLAGIALAGVAGALAGGAGSSGSPSRARGSFVAGGPLQVVVPSAWQRVPVPRVPGLGLADAVAVGPPGQPTGVVLGRDTTPDATLLPSDLVSRLPRAPSTGQPVRVGDVEAYRYGALRPRGYAGTLIAYVAPTNRGVATVACFSTNAGIPVTSECPRVAASLTLAGATGRPLGPDPAYAATLSRAVAHLNAVRAATVSRLRLAKGPARQAQAADAIARAYAEASRTLSSSGTPPQARAANGRIVAALGASARWWAGLADAARHRSRAAYARRRSHVQQAETATARALRDLSRLGYRTTP